jgi:glycosyltransferase involved in cell wall biosynthesis
MTADAVGGVWRYAVDLGSTLRRRGVEVTVAVMGPSPSAAQRGEARRAGLELLDRPYRLEWMDNPWADVSSAGEWLLDVARAITPSVIHLNGYAHAALPWNAPVMVVAHSCVRTWWAAVRREPAPASASRYTAIVDAGLGAADAVVAPTHAMAAALAREYRSRPRVRIIPNGGVPRRAPRRSRRKAPFVLAAGRVWDDAKNITALCSIAPSVGWPILVAGDASAPGGEPCEAPHVHLLGHLSSPALARWYGRAAIYALPARYEPFGLSVLEAAAAGCALVLGDIDSLRENWDGAALFVDPDDHAGLAAAIQGLIADPDLRAHAGRLAAARASTFALDRTADAYLNLYQSLLT